MTLRPAREISIQVRRRAVHDPASYDPGPPLQAFPLKPNRLPLRLLIVAFTGLAAGLGLLALQLPLAWGWPTAAVACAGVWALWRITDPGARLAGPRYKGRHRRPRRPAPNTDIELLQVTLEPCDDAPIVPRRTDQTVVSRP